MSRFTGPVPLCQTCDHHHHAHEKCPVCGHIGKSKSYRRYDDKCISVHKQDSNISLRVVAYCGRRGPAAAAAAAVAVATPQMARRTQAESESRVEGPSWRHLYCTDEDSHVLKLQRGGASGDWQLAVLLRHLIFGEQCRGVAASTAGPSVVDEQPTTLHCLLFCGDVPVAYSRWRFLRNSSGLSAATASPPNLLVAVELIGTLPPYRRKGFAARMMHCMLQRGVQHCCAALGTTSPPSECRILCPPQLRRLCLKFKFQPRPSVSAAPRQQDPMAASRGEGASSSIVSASLSDLDPTSTTKPTNDSVELFRLLSRWPEAGAGPAPR